MLRIVADFFGFAILISILFVALEFYFQVNAPHGTVATAVSGMMSGLLHGGRTGRQVSSGFAWKVATVLTFASVTLFFVLQALVYSAGAQVFTAGLSLVEFLAALVGIAAVILLLIRFSFRSGVKHGAKRNPRRVNPEIFD